MFGLIEGIVQLVSTGVSMGASAATKKQRDKIQKQTNMYEQLKAKELEKLAMVKSAGQKRLDEQNKRTVGIIGGILFIAVCGGAVLYYVNKKSPNPTMIPTRPTGLPKM